MQAARIYCKSFFYLKTNKTKVKTVTSLGVNKRNHIEELGTVESLILCYEIVKETW